MNTLIIFVFYQIKLNIKKINKNHTPFSVFFESISLEGNESYFEPFQTHLSKLIEIYIKTEEIINKQCSSYI